jgi:hypothetical protein
VVDSEDPMGKVGRKPAWLMRQRRKRFRTLALKGHDKESICEIMELSDKQYRTLNEHLKDSFAEKDRLSAQQVKQKRRDQFLSIFTEYCEEGKKGGALNALDKLCKYETDWGITPKAPEKIESSIDGSENIFNAISLLVGVTKKNKEESDGK